MTKTLTEQWREGKLEEGYYYIRWSFNIDDEPSYMIDFFDTEYFAGGAFINKQRKFIDEVMSVVPSYEEYKRLQEQLNEANDTLIKSQNMKQPDRNNFVAQYLLKWGMK